MIANIYNKFRRITSNQLYLPEIDGIRFIAILLVVLFHIHAYFISPEKNTLNFSGQTYNNLFNTFLTNGDRGVELFFVLSGFILCIPFARQYINHGKKVSLKKYYLRRLTRLEPPYFIAMTGLFLLQLVMKMGTPAYLAPHWLASLAYAHDIIYHRVPVLTVVAWSLEIEIQFYIMAPLLFRLLALDRTLRRLLLLTATAGIVYLQKVFPPAFLSIYGFAQYFFIGILLADLYVSNAATALFTRKWIPVFAVIVFLVIIYLPVKNETLPAGELFLARLCLPFSIGLLYYAIFKNGLLKSVLSYKFVPIIGGMCYSVYLLHYTIISFAGRYTLRFHISSRYFPNLILQIVLLCIPVLIVSSVYYYYVERPFMSRKWLDMLLKKDKKKDDVTTTP